MRGGARGSVKTFRTFMTVSRVCAVGVWGVCWSADPYVKASPSIAKEIGKEWKGSTMRLE